MAGRSRCLVRARARARARARGLGLGLGLGSGRGLGLGLGFGFGLGLVITRAPTAREPRCLLVIVHVALARRARPVPVLQHWCSAPGALS